MACAVTRFPIFASRPLSDNPVAERASFSLRPIICHPLPDAEFTILHYKTNSVNHEGLISNEASPCRSQPAAPGQGGHPTTEGHTDEYLYERARTPLHRPED